MALVINHYYIIIINLIYNQGTKSSFQRSKEINHKLLMEK